MNNTIPKAIYLTTYSTNTGATFSVPVSMDDEINTVQDYQSLASTVAKYAVGQGQVRSLDDINILSSSLLNPGRDVNAIANELLEKAFVELYEAHYESASAVDSHMAEMYNSINGAANNG